MEKALSSFLEFSVGFSVLFVAFGICVALINFSITYKKKHVHVPNVQTNQGHHENHEHKDISSKALNSRLDELSTRQFSIPITPRTRVPNNKTIVDQQGMVMGGDPRAAERVRKKKSL